MILFNAFLFFFSSPDYFGLSDVDGKNINESTLSTYNVDSQTFASSLINGVLTGGFIGLAAIGAAIATKSYVLLGAGLLMSLIGGLWAGAFTYVGAIFEPFPLANYLYNILFIVTGIIAFIAIAEIFTGRTGDD